MLMVLALARLGRYVRYLPTPVIEGFTAGIAVVIALQQVPGGARRHRRAGEKVWAVAADAVPRFAAHPHPAPPGGPGRGGADAARRPWRPGLPFSLLGVAAATAASPRPRPGPRSGPLPAGLPTPRWASSTPAQGASPFGAGRGRPRRAGEPAVSHRRRRDDRRRAPRPGPGTVRPRPGQLAAPLFGGIPATAAIARTAVNVRAGAARSSLLTHAVALALVLAAAPLVARIPLAALAGVLLATTVRMVEAGSLLALAAPPAGTRWSWCSPSP